MSTLPDPSPKRSAVARERGFRLCVKSLSRTLLTTPAAWGLVCWMAWARVPHGQVLAWLGFAVAARAAELAILRQLAHESGQRRIAVAGLCTVAALDGATWGLTVLVLGGFDATLDPWLTAFLCGVVAINFPVYVTYIRAYGFLMGTLWLMVLVGAVLQPHRPGLREQVAGVTLFFGLLAYHMPAFARHALRSIQLRLDNDALSERLRGALDAMSAQASTDPLTGQPNRRALDELLAGQLRRAADTGAAFCVLLVDIDDFKRVNDEHGHLVGDDTLRAFAQRAREQLRQGDVCARYGGEEFVVVLPSTRLDAARDIAERLRRGVDGHPLPIDPPLRITVSIGVAEHQPAETPLALLARADAAVYQAKHGGRNRVCAAPGGAPAAHAAPPAAAGATLA